MSVNLSSLLGFEVVNNFSCRGNSSVEDILKKYIYIYIYTSGLKFIVREVRIVKSKDDLLWLDFTAGNFHYLRVSGSRGSKE